MFSPEIVITVFDVATCLLTMVTGYLIGQLFFIPVCPTGEWGFSAENKQIFYFMYSML